MKTEAIVLITIAAAVAAIIVGVVLYNIFKHKRRLLNNKETIQLGNTIITCRCSEYTVDPITHKEKDLPSIVITEDKDTKKTLISLGDSASYEIGRTTYACISNCSTKIN